MQDATSSLPLAICLWQVSGDRVTPHTSRYGVSYYKRQSADGHRPAKCPPHHQRRLPQHILLGGDDVWLCLDLDNHAHLKPSVWIW
ncbi:hypothetical protein Sar04_38300 [Salinispora arenicola]|uniref:Uncharacterized protein n=1 Tax=Salinispora arenicola TaxID=168697 RepID=A0A542XM35_SALAC|nr:hypothetical protein FB564_2036 [Salinispora arenicola]GIM87094.1 hypothetical protein Sar04_38300 [Salinispora arenicola]